VTFTLSKECGSQVRLVLITWDLIVFTHGFKKYVTIM